MTRLHSETIPTSTLAATARVVDGFVTTQSATDGCGNATATVDDADFDAPSDVTIERVVNHEFGHNLGLQHPGAGYTPKNELAEYAYKGTDQKGNFVDGTVDLMGLGEKLRDFYFNSWVNYLNSHKSRCAKQNNGNDQIR